MRVYRAEDYKAMSRRAASIIAAQVMQKPDCVLGLATGSTPIGAYEQLVEWYKQGDLSFKEVSSVNLDEYLGLTGDHPQSYRYFMQKNLFDHVDIDVAKTNVPSGMAEDAEAESKRYEKVMADLGGIDLQLLGMGHNGHIGFNEPAADVPRNLSSRGKRDRRSRRRAWHENCGYCTHRRDVALTESVS